MLFVGQFNEEKDLYFKCIQKTTTILHIRWLCVYILMRSCFWLWTIMKLIIKSTDFLCKILQHCCTHWPCWLHIHIRVSSLTKALVCQSVLFTFASAYALVMLTLCVKYWRNLKRDFSTRYGTLQDNWPCHGHALNSACNSAKGLWNNNKKQTNPGNKHCLDVHTW